MDQPNVQEFYDQVFPNCRGYVARYGGTEEDAREIFQRSLLILLVKLKNPDFNPKKGLKEYLFGIVRNQWQTERDLRLKKAGTTESDRDLELADDPEDFEEKSELEQKYARMFAALRQVSEECRRLLRLTFYNKTRDKEIAKVMDYSVEFVRNKRRRCIRQIRSHLD